MTKDNKESLAVFAKNLIENSLQQINDLIDSEASQDEYREVIKLIIFKVYNKFTDGVYKISINKSYNSEEELYFKMIALHNIIYDWGLSSTQIWILVYLMRYKYNNDTKKIISENLNITMKSLSTNLSYMRTGNVNKKKIKKLLKIDNKNMNVTIIGDELKDIIKIIEKGTNTLTVKFQSVSK